MHLLWSSEATQRFCDELAKWHTQWQTELVSHMSGQGGEGMAREETTRITAEVTVRCSCGWSVQTVNTLLPEYGNRVIHSGWTHICPGDEGPIQQEINFDGRLQRWALS